MSKYPSDLLTLIAFLKKLPGVGSKTAERFAFQLLNWSEKQLGDFGTLIAAIKDKICHCPDCSCLMEENQCFFCDPNKRDTQILCIISSAKDAFILEETRSYRGLYHVLGGLLSPLDGRTPEHLQFERLKARIQALSIKEVIIALDSTLEGDATSLYLKQQLGPLSVAVSRLAFGLPLGSTLDFASGGTLSRALTGRQSF
jgi:recombination protein RecR